MFKNYKRMYLYQKEMHEHYASLFEVCVWELEFHKLLEESLYNILDEIREVSNEELVKAIIDNALKRYQLDKLVHIKKLFPNPEWFSKWEEYVLQEKEDSA